MLQCLSHSPNPNYYYCVAYGAIFLDRWRRWIWIPSSGPIRAIQRTGPWDSFNHQDVNSIEDQSLQPVPGTDWFPHVWWPTCISTLNSQWNASATLFRKSFISIIEHVKEGLNISKSQLPYWWATNFKFYGNPYLTILCCLYLLYCSKKVEEEVWCWKRR